jgi:ABC-2 type transport system permease protein
MKKLFLIGRKDIRLAFRDRAALILMLAAPFVLTVGLGLVSGWFSGGAGSGLSDIPVVIVNLDDDQLGNALADAFKSDDLSDLVEPRESEDAAAARRLVDDDEVAAAVIIPAGFTDSVIPQTGFTGSAAPAEAAVVTIEVYANPARPTGAGVIQAIVEEFTTRVEEGRTAGTTAITRLLATGLLAPGDAQGEGQVLSQSLGSDPETALIRIKDSTEGTEVADFDILAYMAPAMALLFLMYTVSYGGRTILTERNQGTLPRLLVSPTTPGQVLNGKALGIYFTGAAQLFILIGGTSLMFGLLWGDPLGVVVLVLAAVFAATGWGMLITAVARTPAQVASIGTAVMLTFGILGGSFISLDQMGPLVQALSKITPNAWGLDGFTTLALGGTLADILKPVLALLIMGGVLLTISVVLFRRNNILQR